MSKCECTCEDLHNTKRTITDGRVSFTEFSHQTPLTPPAVTVEQNPQTHDHLTDHKSRCVGDTFSSSLNTPQGGAGSRFAVAYLLPIQKRCVSLTPTEISGAAKPHSHLPTTTVRGVFLYAAVSPRVLKPPPLLSGRGALLCAAERITRQTFKTSLSVSRVDCTFNPCPCVFNFARLFAHVSRSFTALAVD